MSAHPIGLFSPNSPEARLRTRRKQLRNVHRNNPQVATWAVAATEIARLYPGAPAGVVLSMAQSGISPQDPLVKQVMTEALMTNPPPGEEKPPDRGGIMGVIGDIGGALGEIDDAVLSVTKPVIRTGFTALESLEEEFTGLIRAGGYAGVKAKEDGVGSFLGNFWEVLSESGSTGRLALGDLLTGDKVDLGEGFFAGGELEEKQKRLAERWTIDGNPISIGRVVANKVAEPGTTSYNTVSGLLDASVILAADPASVLLRSASNANKARKAFVDITDPTITGRAAEKLGNLTGLRSRAGLVDASRKQVILDRANRWLDTEAEDLVDQLAGSDDFLATYNFLGRKVRGTTVADLVDAKTKDEVRNVLRNEITEGNMRNKLPAGGSTFLNRKLPKVTQSRIFDMMPSARIDFDDLDDGVEQARRWMANMRLPEEDQTRVLSNLVRSENKVEMFDVVVGDMLKTAEKHLVDELGVAPGKAKGLVTAFAGDTDRMRDYGVTELVEDAAAVGIRVNEQFERVMSPMLYNQLLDRGIPLPDPREIRKAVSDWAPVLNNSAVRAGENAISFIQDKLWKRAVLLRGAWTVRVVGEEQVRIAGSGGQSLVNHPLSALAWITGRKGGADVLGEDFKGVRSAMEQAAMGEADDFANALARGAMGLDGERKISRFAQVVDQSDPAYHGALVDELARMSNDPVARRVARGFPFDDDKVTRAGIDGVKDWFWKSKEREEFAFELPLMGTRRGSDDYIDFLQGHIQSRTGGSDDLRNLIGSRPAAVDPKLNKQMRDLIDQLDPGVLPANVLADSMKVGRVDPSVMDYYDRATEAMFNGLMSIPTNKLSRSPHFRQQYWKRIEELAGMADADTARKIVAQAKDAGLDNAAIKRIEDAASSATAGPTVHDVPLSARRADSDFGAIPQPNGTERFRDLRDRYLDAMRREDQRQAFAEVARAMAADSGYQDSLRRMFSEMGLSPDDYVRVFRGQVDPPGGFPYRNVTFDRDWAERFALGEGTVDEFAVRVRDIRGVLEEGEAEVIALTSALRRVDEVTGNALNLEHVDTLAKGHALDTTKDLLYDLSERSQLFDQMRLITPFGEAWREVITRWAKIGRENPQVLRRSQQVIEGARDWGFFTTDENGVETFAYPGSKMVTQALLGVPVEMRGRVAGLSMMGEIMPGFGPTVQIPVAAMIPDAPELDWVRDVVNPFGAPESPTGIAAFFPSWLQKFQTSDWFPVAKSPEQQRLFMSTMGSTMDALALTGEYDLHGENAREEASRLLDDAKHKTNLLYVLRGAAQFVAPTAPSPEFLANDPEGKLVVIQELADTYREYNDEDRDTAVDRFLQDFGEHAFTLMEGKSTGVFSVSKEVEDWARKNPDLLEKYPETYAFFGPTPPDDEAFDYDTYRRQIARGERIPRTPEEILEAAQHRVAAARMDQFNRIVGPTPSPEKIVARDTLRRQLVERYSGYRPFDLSSDLEQNMEELRRAVSDPKLAENGTANSVAKYMRVRDIMLKIAHARGRKDFGTSNDTQPLRDALRMVAVQIRAENPAFGTVWDRMLQYELRGREEEAFKESEAA